MYRNYRDDVEITSKKKGFVLKSQKGRRWRIRVDDKGNLFTEELPHTVR